MKQHVEFGTEELDRVVLRVVRGVEENPVGDEWTTETRVEAGERVKGVVAYRGYGAEGGIGQQLLADIRRFGDLPIREIGFGEGVRYFGSNVSYFGTGVIATPMLRMQYEWRSVADHCQTPGAQPLSHDAALRTCPRQGCRSHRQAVRNSHHPTVRTV